jgi:hypothetical protein
VTITSKQIKKRTRRNAMRESLRSLLAEINGKLRDNREQRQTDLEMQAVEFGVPFQTTVDGDWFVFDFEPDHDGDFSFLGEFSDEKEKWGIHTGEAPPAYKYFNPSFGCDPDPDAAGDLLISEYGFTPERVLSSVMNDRDVINWGCTTFVVKPYHKKWETVGERIIASLHGNWLGYEGPVMDENAYDILNDLLGEI